MSTITACPGTYVDIIGGVYTAAAGTTTYNTSSIITWPTQDYTTTTIDIDPSFTWPNTTTYTVPAQTWTLTGDFSAHDTSKCLHLMPGDLITVPAHLTSFAIAPGSMRSGIMLSDVCWCNKTAASTGIHFHVHWFDELSHESSTFHVLSHIHAAVKLIQRAGA